MEKNKRGFWLGSVLTVLALLCLLVLPAGAAETEEVPVCFEHGDVNTDGRVNSRDAIDTLYYSLFPDSADYGVNQDCDFNHDGLVDAEDAIYVLYSTFGIFEEFTLEGTVHGYYEPEWIWNEDGSAQAVFKCSCGQSQTLDAQVEVLSSSDVTCTQNGVTEYAANVVFGEQTYSSARTVTVAANGHTMTGTQSCTESSVCESCGYTLAAFGHSWQEDPENSSEATCEEEAVRAYLCGICGETYSETLPGFADHSFYYLEDRYVDNSPCVWQKAYVCDCGEGFLGEINEQHVYKAVLTREATCCETGVKTFTCEYCADTKEETVETVADAHSWEIYNVVDDAALYHCTGCGEEKAVLTTDIDNPVDIDRLQRLGGDLQVDDVSLHIPADTMEDLGQTVAVEVGTVSADELYVDEELKAQIGDNPVYDFNMVTTFVDEETGETSTESVSAFNSIDIYLPYTLQEGDDPECIDVWFIDDDGNVEAVQGTYANGYVKFTTDHFSYYTVTRLTPAQRCELYGHNEVSYYLEPTCLSDGYEKQFCLRCGEVAVDTHLHALGHDYQDLGTAATCTEDGKLLQKCDRCKHQITGTLPALGHSWHLDEAASTVADCYQAGANVYRCGNDGCDESYTEELAQLEHNMELVEEKKNGCSNKGWKLYRCTLCGYEVKEQETAPHGHYYDPADAIVEWSEDYSSATVTLICSHDKSTVSAHTRVLKAVVSHKTLAATCQAGGKIIHTAEVSHNKQDFSFTEEEILPVGDHNTGDTWQNNADEHYKTCSVCGEAVYNGSHIWTTVSTPQMPDCTNSGIAVIKCDICDYETEKVLPANGKHVFVNGKCVSCGYEQGSCDHIARYEVPVDMSGYDICEGANIVWLRCDCGEKKELVIRGLACWMNGSGSEQTTPEGITYWWNDYTCNQCGLNIADGDHPVVDLANCEVNFQYAIIMKLDGETILEHSQDTGNVFQHELVISGDWVDVGLPCGEQVRMDRCLCGQNRGLCYSVNCHWVRDAAASGEYSQVWNCAECGAVRTITRTPIESDDSCIGRFHDVYTFELDGQVVYTTETDALALWHDYEISHVMAGETCTDGVKIIHDCRNCDHTYEEFCGYHALVYQDTISLGGEGFCTDHLEIIRCACGQEQGYNQPWECDFDLVREDSDWDFTLACNICGLTIDHQTLWSGKDEHCFNSADQTVTVKNRDGRVITSFHNYWTMEQHNHKEDYILKGDSCTDGVEIVIYCPDCDTEFNRFLNKDHVRFREPLEISSLGYDICGGDVYRYVCPCGEYIHYNYDGPCRMQNYYLDDAWSHQVRTCMDCGLTLDIVRSEPELIPGEICRGWQDVTVTVSMNDTTIMQTSFRTKTEHHTSVICDLNLLPGSTSCEQGYTVVRTCMDCGVTFNNGQPETRYDHNGWCTSIEVIEDERLCGTLKINHYECACGENTGWGENWVGGRCDFSYDDEYNVNGAWVSECSQCGSRRVRTFGENEQTDPCHGREKVTNVYQDKDGNEIARVVRYNNYENHRDAVWNFHMLGETCEDGYTLTGYCHTCNSAVVQDWVNTGCDARVTQRQVLVSDADICGDWILQTYSCGCGKEGWTNLRQACYDREYIGDDEYGNSMYRCCDCGLTWVEEYLGERDEGCRRYENYRTVFSRKGEQLADVTYSELYNNHAYIHTFQMLGDTCDEGYRVFATCQKCGATENWTTSGCDTHTISREVLVSSENACGDITLELSSCPCGAVTGGFVSEGACNLVYQGYDDDGLMYKYQCETCGLTEYVLDESSRIPDSCEMVGTSRYIFEKNGTVLADRSWTERWRNHVTVTEFELLGDSCEDGYFRSESCKYCDYTWESNELRTDHGHYQLDEYDLDSLTCGGSLYRYGCACGKENYWNYWDNCKWNSTGNVNEDGLREYYCESCNTYRYFDSDGYRDRPNCANVGVFVLKLVRDGKVLVDIDAETRQSSHTMLLDSYTFRDEEKGCESGVRAVMKCKYCDYTEESSWGYSHPTILQEFLDLQEINPDVCGGYMKIQKCPCGKNTEFDWDMECDYAYDYRSEQGPDGVYHYFEIYSCSTCGITIEREYSTIKDVENCQAIYTNIYRLYLNDTLERAWEEREIRDYHDYRYTDSQLMEGSQNCYDGVYLTQTCRRCGDSKVMEVYDHKAVVNESIDLAPYGAVCGTTLDRYECACGEISRYELSADGCDMDENHVSSYVDGAINGSQMGTNGWNWYSSSVYDMICAVTHPQQCGMKIRMSEYWMAEDNCTAVEYQTWQLGYDEATGTCMEELTVPTGERRCYHNVDTESFDEQRGNEHVWGNRYTCPVCGSYASQEYFQRDGENGTYKSEYHAVNTLDNGENREYHSIDEDDMVINGFRLDTLSRTEYVYADGDIWWYQYAYEYDYPVTGICTYTRTYTNSYGEKEVYNGEHCNSSYGRYETVKKPTCTQYGEEQYQWYCPICEETTEVNSTYSIEPNDHNWYWSEDKQLYVCSECGLENINGASGSIVMEDMTDSHGDGENYVVGYWNRSGLNVDRKISVILNDRVDENEFVLTGIDIFEYEGITAYGFSQEQAIAAAEMTLEQLGYTGSYAIRFSFVPYTGDTTLDYAITFDSLAA